MNPTSRTGRGLATVLFRSRPPVIAETQFSVPDAPVAIRQSRRRFRGGRLGAGGVGAAILSLALFGCAVTQKPLIAQTPPVQAQTISLQAPQVVGANVADTLRFDMVSGERIFAGQTVLGQGVADSLKTELEPRIPKVGADGRPVKSRDIYDFMHSGITTRHVTPFSRIIPGNGSVREVLPDMNNREPGRYYVSGIGKAGVWAALGLAPTSGGQGSRNGMTDFEAALMYAAIDDAQRFTVFHPTDQQTTDRNGAVDRYEFERDGLIAGQRPAMDEGGSPRVVNTIPLLAQLKPGWNKLIYNPYPIANPDHPCNPGPCDIEWNGQTYSIPQHPLHDRPVSAGGFPAGRMWLVYWDGT